MIAMNSCQWISITSCFNNEKLHWWLERITQQAIYKKKIEIFIFCIHSKIQCVWIYHFTDVKPLFQSKLMWKYSYTDVIFILPFIYCVWHLISFFMFISCYPIQSSFGKISPRIIEPPKKYLFSLSYFLWSSLSMTYKLF